MTYEEMNSFAAMQRKQLLLTLSLFTLVILGAMVFMTVVVSKLTHTTFLPTLSAQPADYTTSSAPASCTGGMGAGPSETSASLPSVSQSSGNVSQQGATLGGLGGGGSLPWGSSSSTGGMGAGGSSPVVSAGSYTYSYQITRNVNSNNAYGSNNTTNNTSTTNNTQGSYNSVSKGGSLEQLNLAENTASNNTENTVVKSGNTENSDNNVSVTKDSGNTLNTAITDNTNVTKDSGNNLTFDSGNTTNTAVASDNTLTVPAPTF